MIKDNFTDHHIFVYGLVLIHGLTSFSLNIGMYFIYTLKIPFFDQYRIEPPENKWPWDEDYA